MNGAVLRTDIERALDEMIAHEEGKRFQALAVVLAKQKYPDLVASEYHKDRGLDAYAAPSAAPAGVGRGVASSITASLEKIRDDARKAKDNFAELAVLIFVTPRMVTNHAKAQWAEQIRREFRYELIVISREDVITSLMLPANLPLCRTSLRINVAIDSDDESTPTTAPTARRFRTRQRPSCRTRSRRPGNPGLFRADLLDRDDWRGRQSDRLGHTSARLVRHRLLARSRRRDGAVLSRALDLGDPARKLGSLASSQPLSGSAGDGLPNSLRMSVRSSNTFA
jgi:hypothetical protein